MEACLIDCLVLLHACLGETHRYTYRSTHDATASIFEVIEHDELKCRVYEEDEGRGWYGDLASPLLLAGMARAHVALRRHPGALTDFLILHLCLPLTYVRMLHYHLEGTQTPLVTLAPESSAGRMRFRVRNALAPERSARLEVARDALWLDDVPLGGVDGASDGMRIMEHSFLEEEEAAAPDAGWHPQTNAVLGAIFDAVLFEPLEQ